MKQRSFCRLGCRERRNTCTFWKPTLVSEVAESFIFISTARLTLLLQLWHNGTVLYKIEEFANLHHLTLFTFLSFLQEIEIV
jgi:hypothetical protein